VAYTLYRDVENTAGKIAEAARRLLKKEGAGAVKMRRVTNAVGITPRAVYRPYPDRAGLLNALADEGLKKLASRSSLRAAQSRNGSQRRWTSTWTMPCRILDS
jgi:AcrR family transcriptional regulator